ncbi:MAG: hypothetical protein FJX76_21990 [Armatimonadetes bacterium]|nr:hypothetical protein [Armatimonadota bacterium]
MMSTISPVLCQMAPVRTEQPVPAVCPQPPQPPTDALDFSKIDSPLKAALLPVNEPALQIGLVAGIMFAVMSAPGGAVPLVTVDMASKSADKLMNASYSLDLKDESNPLTVTGDVAGQPLSDSFTLDEATQSANFTGQIGNNPTSLTLGLELATESLLISGKLGDVEQNVRYSTIKGPNGDDNLRGIHAEGTIGGQEYKADTLFDAQALASGAQEEAQMTVRGSLGGLEISKDYTVTATQMPSGAEIAFKGTGSTAGVAQEVDVKLTLVG